MTTYFILPQEIVEQTDWQAAPYANVGPVKIYSGSHAGSYAVNTKIFESDESFEQYRGILEGLPKATLTSTHLTNPNPPNDA